MTEDNAIPGWDPNTGVYTLKYPATVRSKVSGSTEVIERTLEKVNIRRINGADIRAQDAFKGSDTASGLFMMTRLLNVGPEVIDALDGADIATVGDIIESFQPPGRKTGETS